MFIYGVIICLLSFLLIGFAFIYRKKKNLKSSEFKKRLMKSLKELETDLKASENDEFYNKYEAEKIEQEIEELLSKVIQGEVSTKENEEKAEQIKKSISDFHQNINLKKVEKKELHEKVRRQVKSFKDYLDNHSFYPKELIFTANTLQGKALDLETLPISKITFTFAELEKELSLFQADLEKFFMLHKKLLLAIQDENGLSGNQKQELFFSLQNGEFEKTSQLLEKNN